MKLTNLKLLLTEVYHTYRHHQKVAQLSGDNFNIFQVLNLQTSEVRTHSAFLAELLNPQGSHGQKDKFLSLFVNQVGCKEFDTSSAVAELEKYTGPVNEEYTRGGRIDIIITDAEGRHIIIENKIYAGDQKNQLLRYYNYSPSAHLFYLTLFGDSPSDYSTNSQLEPGQYKLLSYRSDITAWLEQCQKEAVNLPVLRETIGQYTNLIRFLTNQTAKDKTKEAMQEEIKQLLLKNPEYIDAYEACSQVINSLVWETKKKFVESFDSLFPAKLYDLKDGNSLRVNWGEDGDGIYFGYQYHVAGQNASNSARGKELSAIIKGIEAPSAFSSNANYIGWFFAKPFKARQKFEHLDKKLILQLSESDEKLKAFVESLILQADQVTSEILRRIDN